MSYQVFKTNMLLYMQNQEGIKTKEDFAKKLTNEYDMLIRRGFQVINQVSIQKPNKELMETMVNLAGTVALQKQSGLHDIINQIGKGIKMYWLGATLYQFPVPVIPAAGSFMNIMTTSAMVTNPGEFPDMNQQYPTTDSGQFLDMLILGIQIHLLSIEGMYNTVSMYPGFPLVPPAPGILMWKGYTVPGSTGGSAPTTSAVTTPEVEPPQVISIAEATTMKPEQLAASNRATDMGYNMAASTAAGLSGETSFPPPDDKSLGKHQNIDDAPPSEPIQPSEKVSECDNVSLTPPPNQLIVAMRKWGITNPLERAHFLSQCAHESGNFRYTREIWGPTSAQSRYDNHKWLGNEQVGDGKKYLGRGYIQLTGKANYKQFNKGVPDDVVANPVLVEQKYVADTACWFWKTRKISLLAKDDTMASVIAVTKRINGGTNGLDDRKKKFCGYWKQIQENSDLYS